MITYYYESEAAMRGAWPHLAFLLSNTATRVGNEFQAINNGKLYAWPAEGGTP